MDALAADRLLGESPPEMFAFGNYKKGEFEQEQQQWLAKNVTPILYRNHSNHFYLHKTLENWSETYRDGLSGKEQIVVTTAISKPSSSDMYENYARNLAWALSDPTGIPAKRFSKLNPAPALEWLDALSSIELKREDLSRFGVFDKSFSEDLKFPLTSSKRDTNHRESTGVDQELIGLPFLLGLGTSHPLALAIAPIFGVAAFVLTVFTDHHLGIVRVLPYKLHLAIDLAVGLLFLALPVILGFSGLDAAFSYLSTD